MSLPAHRERTIALGALQVTVLEATDVDGLLDAAIAEDRPAPYGSVLWPSGVAVAMWLVEQGDRLAGARVLDVGAGTGLCSLAAASLGADVLAVDVDPLPLQLLDEAARRQALSVETAPFNLLGEEPLPDAEIVLFADLLYESLLARRTGRRAVEALARGSEVVVGDPERAFRDSFSAVLHRAGYPAPFDVRYVDRGPGQPSHRVGVLHLAGSVA